MVLSIRTTVSASEPPALPTLGTLPMLLKRRTSRADMVGALFGRATVGCTDTLLAVRLVRGASKAKEFGGRMHTELGKLRLPAGLCPAELTLWLLVGARPIGPIVQPVGLVERKLRLTGGDLAPEAGC